MKRIYFLLLALMPSLGAFLSCKKDLLKTYDAGRNLYFDVKEDDKAFGSPQQNNSIGSPQQNAVGLPQQYETALDTDSLKTSFAFLDDAVKGKELKILVRLAGPQSDVPLPYSVDVVANGTSASKGLDFELGTDHVFPAGKSVDTLRLKVNRTPLMRTKKLSLQLLLKENSNFATSFFKKGDVKTMSPSLTYAFSDFLPPPPGYLSTATTQGADFYYGKFSKKKLLLIIDVSTRFSWQPIRITNEEYYAKHLVNNKLEWSRNLYRYLSMQKAFGKTVYEEDGTEMTAGPFY